MLLEQLSSICIEKFVNYMDLDGFLRFLGQGACRPVAACGGLWRPVVGDGGRVLPLIITYDLRIEAWKLQSSRPGLMSWLVDLDGLD